MEEGFKGFFKGLKIKCRVVLHREDFITYPEDLKDTSKEGIMSCIKFIDGLINEAVDKIDNPTPDEILDHLGCGVLVMDKSAIKDPVFVLNTNMNGGGAIDKRDEPFLGRNQSAVANFICTNAGLREAIKRGWIYPDSIYIMFSILKMKEFKGFVVYPLDAMRDIRHSPILLCRVNSGGLVPDMELSSEYTKKIEESEYLNIRNIHPLVPDLFTLTHPRYDMYVEDLEFVE